MPTEDASMATADKHNGPGMPEGVKGKKKNETWAKYKWWIIGGGLILAAIVFYAIRSSNAASNTTAAQQGVGNPAPGGVASSTTDPLTGDISGTPQDLADLQGLYGGGGSSTTTPPTSTPTNTTTNAGFQSYAQKGATFAQIEKQYGVTQAQIQGVDPKLFAKYGQNKKLNTGAGYWVPSGNTGGGK